MGKEICPHCQSMPLSKNWELTEKRLHSMSISYLDGICHHCFNLPSTYVYYILCILLMHLPACMHTHTHSLILFIFLACVDVVFVHFPTNYTYQLSTLYSYVSTRDAHSSELCNFGLSTS